MTSLSLDVVAVHYRSGGMLTQLVCDLLKQQGVDLVIHVVECGPDGTVEQLPIKDNLLVHRPGKNLGYCGGNNLGFRSARAGVPILVVNPDVRIPSATTLHALMGYLGSDDGLAAVAPLIRTHDGYVEYLSSRIDFRRAEAVHGDTYRTEVPKGTPTVLDVPWANGACLLFSHEALDVVGGFDESFFLFFEEVDWALRARAAGFRLALVTTCEVGHTRSASFGRSTKGTYYYWRNRWLLFDRHAPDRSWRQQVGQEWRRFVVRPANVRSGASLNAGLARWDALRGRTGPRPWGA